MRYHAAMAGPFIVVATFLGIGALIAMGPGQRS